MSIPSPALTDDPSNPWQLFDYYDSPTPTDRPIELLNPTTNSISVVQRVARASNPRYCQLLSGPEPYYSHGNLLWRPHIPPTQSPLTVAQPQIGTSMQKPIYTASVTRTTVDPNSKATTTTVLVPPTTIEASLPQEVKAALIGRMAQSKDLAAELTNPVGLEFNICNNPLVFGSSALGT